MKEISLSFLTDGQNNFENLFNYLLKESNFELDRFIKGEALVIDEDMPDEFRVAFKDMINEVIEIYKEVDDKTLFWNAFGQLDDFSRNEKFVNWLRKHLAKKMRSFNDAAFIREMDYDDFRIISEYCFKELILKEIAKSQVDDNWDINEISALRKMMFTYIDMMVYRNFSRERANVNMKNLFDIEENYFDLWGKLIEENEDKLWRNAVMWRFNRLEDKMDAILNSLERKGIL